MQHICAPTANILGHLDYQRKNKLSTKRLQQSSIEMKQDITPETTQHKCNKAYASLFGHVDSSRMHTDQADRFTMKSIRGHQCMLMAYMCDTNTMIYRPLNTKLAEELQSTYDELHS